MSLLDLIPAPYRILAEVVLAAALVIGAFVAGHAGGVRAEHARMQLKVDDVQHRWDIARAAQSDAAASAAMANQAETARRVTAQQEVSDEAQRLAARSRAADAVRLAAGVSLQQRVAATAARCSAGAGDTAAAGVSAAASSPGDLLADVQRRMGEAAATVVRFADDSSVVAYECAGHYDALTPPKGPGP